MSSDGRALLDIAASAELAILKIFIARSHPGVDDIGNVLKGHPAAKTDCGERLSRAQAKRNEQPRRISGSFFAFLDLLGYRQPNGFKAG